MDKLTVAFMIVALPVLAIGDILPSPLPGEIPLHRIGYEIVFESLAASAAGAAALRALVKRRWKLRGQVTPEEKAVFERKIDSVRPRLMEYFMKVRPTGKEGIRFNDGGDEAFIERFLFENPDLRENLSGVPIESVLEAVDPSVWDECHREGSPWSTNEDKRELEECCRGRHVSPSWRHVSPSCRVPEELIAMIRRQKEQRQARRRTVLFVVALVVAVIVAWLAGRCF